PARTEFAYGRAGDGNLWLHFFKPLPFAHVPRNERAAHRFARLSMTGPRAYAMYKLDRTWRRIYNELFRRYIAVQPAILARAQAIHGTRMAGHYCLGAHYRHPGHAIECLFKMPTPEQYIELARALLPANRSWKVVLASDYEPAIAAFRTAFGDRLVVQPGVTRASSAAEKQTHHGNDNPAIALGEEVLIDGLLLARCDALIHVTSNLATAVRYMNPGLRMIYCETRMQAAWGFLWSLFDRTELRTVFGALLTASGRVFRGARKRLPGWAQ